MLIPAPWRRAGLAGRGAPQPLPIAAGWPPRDRARGIAGPQPSQAAYVSPSPPAAPLLRPRGCSSRLKCQESIAPPPCGERAAFGLPGAPRRPPAVTGSWGIGRGQRPLLPQPGVYLPCGAAQPLRHGPGAAGLRGRWRRRRSGMAGGPRGARSVAGERHCGCTAGGGRSQGPARPARALSAARAGAGARWGGRGVLQLPQGGRGAVPRPGSKSYGRNGR